MFIRKEIESITVQESTLSKSAMQVAINNALSKRKAKLWLKKQRKVDPVIPESEVRTIQKQFKTNTPWTPWRGLEVRNG